MDAPEISWRPLGQLFVGRGLLTEERLEHALAVQVEKGGRLGEKLVELGYVSSSALAELLAEQYGVELHFDTGFGTGLRAELERRYEKKTRPETPDAPADEVPILKLVEPVSEPLEQLAGLEEQWAKLAAAEARVAEMERELEVMRERLGETEPVVAVAAAKPRPRGSRNGANPAA